MEKSVPFRGLNTERKLRHLNLVDHWYSFLKPSQSQQTSPNCSLHRVFSRWKRIGDGEEGEGRVEGRGEEMGDL